MASKYLDTMHERFNTWKTNLYSHYTSNALMLVELFDSRTTENASKHQVEKIQEEGY